MKENTKVTLISTGYGGKETDFYKTYLLYGHQEIPGAIHTIITQEEKEVIAHLLKPLYMIYKHL